MPISTARVIVAIHTNIFQQEAHVSGGSSRTITRVFLGVIGIFAGIVHLALAGPHFEEAVWLGTAFLVDGLGLGATGIWVLLSDTRRARFIAGVTATLTAIAFLVSRTFGLPGMEPEAWDALGLVTTLAELAIVTSWLFLEVSRTRGGGRAGLKSSERRDE